VFHKTKIQYKQKERIKKMKTKLFFVFVLSALLLASCASPTPVTIVKTVEVEKVITPTPEPEVKFTNIQIPLGWLNNDEFAALQVAQAKGFYSDVGLNVNLVSGGGSTGFNPLVAVNGFDDSVRIGVPAALSLAIKAYSEGIDVVAVASLMQFEPSGFIALTKNGLQAKSPCDFSNGAVVSMQTDGLWYVGALAAVCDTGPKVEGTDFTLIDGGFTPDCLLNGSCDYYCGWATNQVYMLDQAGLVKGKDYEMFLTADYAPFYYADVIVTTHDFLKRNPEQIKAFVQASMKGLQYTVDNPDEAATISASVPGVDLGHAQWRIPIQNSLSVSDETKNFGLGYLDPVKVQAMIDFMYANGYLTKSFKAEEIIDNSFITK
jgi:NitT/TauT family transport system substrate-binding protein